MKSIRQYRADDEAQQHDDGQQHNLSPHRNLAPSAGIRMSWQRQEGSDSTNDREPQANQVFGTVVPA